MWNCPLENACAYCILAIFSLTTFVHNLGINYITAIRGKCAVKSNKFTRLKLFWRKRSRGLNHSHTQRGVATPFIIDFKLH